MEYIALAIPIFFVLMALEWYWGNKEKLKVYRLTDTISNLSCGIGQQVIGFFLSLGTVAAYGFIYDHWRLYTLPVSWWMWILLFLGVDLMYYWFHRLSHEVNFLWASHVVHHQSEDYNLGVALRQSWFQQFFSWLFYIPLAWIGFHPTHLLTVVAFNTLYQFWIHTELLKNLGPLEWIFNTPSHHRVHHGRNPEYIDKNHGGTLIIWDRLFGTFEPERAPVVYGITTPLNSFHSFKANFQYWFYLHNLSKKCRGLLDFLKTWVAFPGWKPQYLGGTEIPTTVSRSQNVKYDVRLAQPIEFWLFIQFLLTVVLSASFLYLAPSIYSTEANSHGFLISWSFIILFHLFTFGQILQDQQNFLRLEFIRLFLTLAVIISPLVAKTAFPPFYLSFFFILFYLMSLFTLIFLKSRLHVRK